MTTTTAHQIHFIGNPACVAAHCEPALPTCQHGVGPLRSTRDGRTASRPICGNPVPNHGNVCPDHDEATR